MKVKEEEDNFPQKFQPLSSSFRVNHQSKKKPN